MTNIMHLPSEVLCEIFKNLSNRTHRDVALVSHQWNRLSTTWHIMLHRYREQNLPQKHRAIIFNKLLNHVKTGDLKLENVCFYTRTALSTFVANSDKLNFNTLDLRQKVLSCISSQRHSLRHGFGNTLDSLAAPLNDIINQEGLLKSFAELCGKAIDELNIVKSHDPFVYLIMKLLLEAIKNHLDYQSREIEEIFIPFLSFINCSNNNATIFEMLFDSNREKFEEFFKQEKLEMFQFLKNRFIEEAQIYREIEDRLPKLRESDTTRRYCAVLQALGFNSDFYESYNKCLGTRTNSMEKSNNDQNSPANYKSELAKLLSKHPSRNFKLDNLMIYLIKKTLNYDDVPQETLKSEAKKIMDIFNPVLFKLPKRSNGSFVKQIEPNTYPIKFKRSRTSRKSC